MKRNSKTYLLQVAETHDGDDGDWKKAIGRQQKLKLKLRWPWRSVAASGHPARPFRSIVPSSCHSIVIITYIVVSHAQRIFYARTVAYAYTSPRIRTRRHAFRQQGNESEMAMHEPSQGQATGIILGFAVAGVFFLLIVIALFHWYLRRINRPPPPYSPPYRERYDPPPERRPFSLRGWLFGGRNRRSDSSGDSSFSSDITVTSTTSSTISSRV